MATQLGVRGFNPIWAEFDLDGNLFDDTFYMYTLENTIPYIPYPVYHDPNLNVPWTDPIQFLGNGTLPVDIYFVPGIYYRLEFRKNNGIDPPSQNDPLIYEVNNYIVGPGGDTPIDTVALASSNQITNPQFALINFLSPLVYSGSSTEIDVGPGWVLELTGTGTLTMTQVPLNNATTNPSNASYALEINVSGWDDGGVVLRQRFQQNGMLWANKVVSSAITARVQGSRNEISARLVDSNDTQLGFVLEEGTVVTGAFTEFTGYAELGDSTNPDVPPAAYIDYQLILPSAVNIYVTSIQLVVQEEIFEPPFEQDSIERQIDHTFHNYYNQILIQPKDTILTGWDFSMNPWQFSPTASTNFPYVSGTIGYAADQTIIKTENADSIRVGTSNSFEAYYLTITARTAVTQGQIAIIQYIDTASMYPYWNNFLSSLVRVRLQGGAATDVRFKMRLIWRTDAPPSIGAAEPIVSFDATTGDPVFSAGWTDIAPVNDPEYSIGQSIFDDIYAFNGFELPRFESGATVQYLGAVIYTTTALNNVTPDRILFHSVSLMPNEFAIDVNAKTFSQTLADCQFYYEKSYDQGVIVDPATGTGAVTTSNEKCTIMNSYASSSNDVDLAPSPFDLDYTEKRANPNITFYSPSTGTAGTVLSRLYYLLTGTEAFTSPTAASTVSTFWASAVIGTHTTSLQPKTGSSLISRTNGSNSSRYTSGCITYHFVADARLGI